MLEDKKTLQLSLEAIESRNRKVEINKAWETSRTRRVCIALFTYVIAGLYMHFGLEIDQAALHALVPTGGYLLSTVSLPLLKKIWAQHFFNQTP
jgi:hypothetical protein